MKRALLVIVVATGCARGSGAGQNDAQEGDAPRPDASPLTDGPPTDGPLPDGPLPDAAMIDAPMIDAAMIDAPMLDAPMVDAACTPVSTQLLSNPTFDASPVGAGWAQQLIQAGYPLITDEDGVTEHTAPYKAWLGGFEASSGDVTDVLYQNVTIPLNTTQLRLTGFYFVGSDESSGSTSVWDTADVQLTQTNGALITQVLGLSNVSETTAWTSFSFTFPQDLSGQTVRLRFTSSNDILNATSFWFDTLSLTATHCP